jgi:hypothetical protein
MFHVDADASVVHLKSALRHRLLDATTTQKVRKWPELAWKPIMGYTMLLNRVASMIDTGS